MTLQELINALLFDEGCSEEEIVFIDETTTEDFIERSGNSSGVQDDSRADTLHKQLKNT